MKKIAFVFAALVSLSSPVLASAPECHERAIKVHDLDLSRPADQHLFKKRVNNAMESVCGSYEGAGSSGEETEYDRITQCRKDVRAQIDRQVSANH